MKMGMVMGITVAVDIVMVVVVAIIEAKVITKIIIIIDLVVVIRTTRKGKMRREHLPNIILKKTLVINVKCLVIF